MNQLYKKYVLLLSLIIFFPIVAMQQTPEQLLQEIQQNKNITCIDKSLFEIKNYCGENIFHLACGKGDIESIEKMFYQKDRHYTDNLLFQGDNYGYLGIHKAARNGQAVVIKTLLIIQRCNREDAWKLVFHNNNQITSTPLHLAATKGNIQTVKEVLIGIATDTRLKKALLWQNFGGSTALHLAVRNGHIEITKLFLHIADDSAQELSSIYDSSGMMAVHYALKHIWGEFNKNGTDLLNVFIQTLGYNILHVKTKQGVTLIDFAINNNHIDIINLLKSLKQECTLCLATKHYTELYTMNNCNETSGCKFSFCKACLIEHITTHLDDNNTQELKCPNVNCAKKINALDIHAITENRKELYDRFLEVSFNEFKIQNPHLIKSCPTPDCNCAYSIEGIDVAQHVQCLACNHKYCATCQYDHTNMTCENAGAIDHDCSTCITRHARNVFCEAAARDRAQTKSSLEELCNKQVKPCPNCNVFIQKDQGCNHMSCKRCAHEFCWTCLSAYRTTQCNSGWCDVYQVNTGINF